MTIVTASGPLNAKIAIVGMAPGREEVATGVPFTGASGQILNKSLAKLGVERKEETNED